MPVYKYRRIEDMPSERWLEPGDPKIADRIRFVSAMAAVLTPPLAIPRGVHKYRSFEELDEDRERWVQHRVDSIRARKVAGK